MNKQEQDSAARGIDALNASLASLGYPPVGENPEVYLGAPVMGGIPNAVVERPGVAPIRLLFGRDLDIWVGPHSEVVTVEAGVDSSARLEEWITRVLTSEVLCERRGKKSVELILQLPGQTPWLRLLIRGASEDLESRYQPYASQC